ncbi:MAG: restriction endonuclease subunit S [Gilliamella sp.]|nr:restriction endonuclease subunit S [Gilliamella sp.]MCO6555102.1 restriction endonuclease subunit S [Gilliamella sp.]
MSQSKKLIPKRRFKGFEGASHWNIIQLGDIADIIGGGTPSTNIKAFWNGNIDWYSPTEIGEQIYLNNSEKKITQLGLEKSSAKILPIGSILYTSRAGIGNTAILAKEGCTNQGFQSIVPDKNKLNSYFIYSRSKELKKYGEINGAGSTFTEISGKQLAKMPITLPNLKEQTQIGEFFKKLDNLINTQQKKLEKAKTLKSAYLMEMFPNEGELKPRLRFIGFIKDWKLIKLGEAGSTTSGIGFPDSEQGGEHGIPFYKVSDMNKIGNEIEMKLANNYVTSEQISNRKWNPITTIPAIIFAKVGAAIMLNRKRLVRTEFLIDNNMMAYIFDNTWNINFGKVLFETINLAHYSQVGALPSYNSSDIEKIDITFPNTAEQTKIGNFFKLLDDKIALEQKKLAKLKNIKQAYLNEMFV